MIFCQIVLCLHHPLLLYFGHFFSLLDTFFANFDMGKLMYIFFFQMILCTILCPSLFSAALAALYLTLCQSVSHILSATFEF